MKLLIGIGNPGGKYQNTRHNTGFLVVEQLQKQISNSKHQITNKFQIQISKSTNFMNESGSCVKKLIDKYKVDPSNLYIIHDDLDIELGEYKIQFAKGPKDHNGIKSIDGELGTNEYWRVRVGVDNRIKNYDLRIKGEEYVLQDFTEEEKKILDRVVRRIVDDLERLINRNNSEKSDQVG